MAVSKVVYGNETLVDLTGDSVTPETLAEGVTAHDASGEQITGTMSQVQANWLQNDATQKDYVKNRTHYVEAVIDGGVSHSILFDGTTGTLNGYTKLGLEIGKTYIIKIDNINISCVAQEFVTDGIACGVMVSGNVDGNNISFIFIDVYSELYEALGTTFLAERGENDTWANFWFYTTSETVYKLDKKYLDLSHLSLGVHTDGLIYVMVDGEPVGTGLSLSQGTTDSDVTGVVDENNNITISGDLADGTYTLKYINADGSTTEIGTLTVSEEVETFTVVSECSNCSVNGDTTSPIEYGNPYTATITVNDGYTLDSVTVTMGGVDITSSVYSNGTISIPSVTGNIVIYASAKQQITYTNLVPTAKLHTDITQVFNTTGYKDGVRASSSSPYYSTASGYVTTGCFEVNSSTVLYIKGVTISTSDSNTRFGFARELNGAISNYAVTSGAITTHTTLETLGDKYYKVTFNTSYLDTNCSQLKWFFFSAVGSGADLIVSETPLE